MRRIAASFATVAFIVAVLSGDVASAGETHPVATPTPKVMASAGDSITRAFNVGWCCVLQDSPSRSWSTGTNGAVNSHYTRLLALDGRLAGQNHNDARSGAKMRDLAGQLSAAASQRADYLTVLMGANDVCASDAASMTATSTFESQFRSALAQFTASRPQARVFVASIPDIEHLWELFRSNPLAVSIWSLFGICQSVLDTSITDATRQQAVNRLHSFNDILASVCTEFRQCRWDGYAVFKTQFAAGDVSSIDYFHPSTAGQRRLAEVTWAASYWA
jgi:lysophospholipase L1-like esterase